MEVSDADLEWIEQFYKDLESGLEKYVRPVDYIERAIRVLYGTRKIHGFQHEGRKGYFNGE